MTTNDGEKAGHQPGDGPTTEGTVTVSKIDDIDFPSFTLGTQ